MTSTDSPSPRAGQPRWLVQLDALLRRLRLPVREITCGRGTLRVVLGSKETPSLVATVRPLSSLAPGWAATSRFVLGYDGAGSLDGPARRQMEALRAVLARLEHLLPGDLGEHGAILGPGVSPKERFSRLYWFCDVERSAVGGREVVEVLLRATSRCNQSCPFCSAPLHDTPPPELVVECIEEVGRVHPGCLLSITGGEPTLWAPLAREVQRALACQGIAQVQVQTNAVAFAGRLDAAGFPPGPRLSFFVSLHALREEIYDRCTATTGQLAAARTGLTRLIAAGHRVTVNCVVSSINLDHLESYMRMLPQILPTDERVALHFSVLICPEHRPEAARWLVPYTILAPRIEAAARLGEEAGLRIDPLRSSTHAAMPACLLAPKLRDRDPHRPHLRPGESGIDDLSRPWVKAPGCRRCVESDWCLGVPAPYAARFGLDELSPIVKD